MNAPLSDSPMTLSPSGNDAEMAKASSLAMTQLLTADRTAGPVRLVAGLGEGSTEVVLPESAVEFLASLLGEFAKGNAVTMLPLSAELSTQQASDLLGVSRPFLIEQLERGELPFRKVGTHRRVLLKDLLEYKRAVDQKRNQTLDELAAEAQDLKMGY